MRILVTGVKPWSMIDKDTGEVLQGEIVEYFDVGSIERSDRFRGLQGFKSSKPKDVVIGQVPGLYECAMQPRRNQKGRMEMSIATAELVAPIDFEAMGKEAGAGAKAAAKKSA